MKSDALIAAIPVVCGTPEGVGALAFDIGKALPDLTIEDMRLLRNALVDFEPPGMSETLRWTISVLTDAIDGYRAYASIRDRNK